MPYLFIYGMCVMFYSMMVWMFWRKGNDKLSRLIMLLMVVLDLECLKDLALYLSDFELHKSMWHWVNATDMVRCACLYFCAYGTGEARLAFLEKGSAS